MYKIKYKCVLLHRLILGEWMLYIKIKIKKKGMLTHNLTSTYPESSGLRSKLWSRNFRHSHVTWGLLIGHTKTSQHKPAHASTRQHVHFALFSEFFCIRILVKVFPTFSVKISANRITVIEILRIF